MAKKSDTVPCKMERAGDELVFKIPVERLLQLTLATFTGGDIVDPEAYVTDLMASLNRGFDRGHTEIESMLVAEVEHVYDMGAASVRLRSDVDETVPAPAP